MDSGVPRNMIFFKDIYYINVLGTLNLIKTNCLLLFTVITYTMYIRNYILNILELVSVNITFNQIIYLVKHTE